MANLDQRKVYEEYYVKIYTLAYYITRDEEMSKDITQDTFFTAFKKIHQLKSEEKIESWLISIATNLSRNALKKREYRLSEYQPELKESGNPYDQVELKMAVTDALDSLSPAYKEAILLYYYYGFSINEISQILDVNQKTVSSRLSRARRLIREKIGPEQKGEGGTSIVRSLP